VPLLKSPVMIIIVILIILNICILSILLIRVTPSSLTLL
jgi:hypothetical protein